MPQHLDADPSNDLPLDTAPDSWLPGFDTSGMAGYEPLPLAMDLANPGRSVASLQQESAAFWSSLQRSTRAPMAGKPPRHVP